MTEKLRLGPLPKTETVKLAITLTAAVKADLDRYAELFSAAHGEVVDATSLAPHMLAAFMERDRAFRRAQTARSRKNGSAPLATSAAVSSTSATAGENSS